MSFGIGEVLGVHRSHDLVGFDSIVKTINELIEERLTANSVEQGFHASQATVTGMPEDRLAPAVGMRAPAFNLADQHGDKVRLSSFKGRKVLVYFYPKADTPGCTTQACGLRDIAGEIGDAVIIGISPDESSKLEKFDSKYELGFTLLSDPTHATSEKYGVWAEKSMYGRKYMGVVRSAFLINEKGTLSHSWPKISPKDTPKKLLDALTPDE